MPPWTASELMGTAAYPSPEVAPQLVGGSEEVGW